MSSGTSKRLHILQTASQLILEQGVGHLTLEAVAKAAGVSKGGLLYHFPDKKALIVGMLDQFIGDFEAEMTTEMERDPLGDQTGRWLRAYVRASFSPHLPHRTLLAAGLASLVAEPVLLERLQARYEIWVQRAIQDGIAPDSAALVMAATDGLWYSEMFGLAPLGEDLRNTMMARLFRLINENH
jgi:AcrR family transcriptional regulator